MIKNILLAIIIYFAIGIIVVALDYWRNLQEPVYSQPQYVYKRDMRIILLWVVFWPLLIYLRIRYR